jgi:8-oxo-dGTP pyrophosphatase MutT (NUDIX family)
MVALAAEHRTAGTAAAVPALAASVILVRDSPAGLQTYLLHRHARMPFAASMVVFPGGRVDGADGADAADPLRACGVRETLEETGVRLQDDELVPWAHWITPEIEHRRYDTFFFVAALPAGEVPSDISGGDGQRGLGHPAGGTRRGGARRALAHAAHQVDLARARGY